VLLLDSKHYPESSYAIYKWDKSRKWLSSRYRIGKWLEFYPKYFLQLGKKVGGVGVDKVVGHPPYVAHASPSDQPLGCQSTSSQLGLYNLY